MNHNVRHTYYTLSSSARRWSHRYRTDSIDICLFIKGREEARMGPLSSQPPGTSWYKWTCNLQAGPCHTIILSCSALPSSSPLLCCFPWYLYPHQHSLIPQGQEEVVYNMVGTLLWTIPWACRIPQPNRGNLPWSNEPQTTPWEHWTLHKPQPPWTKSWVSSGTSLRWKPCRPSNPCSQASGRVCVHSFLLQSRTESSWDHYTVMRYLLVILNLWTLVLCIFLWLTNVGWMTASARGSCLGFTVWWLRSPGGYLYCH